MGIFVERTFGLSNPGMRQLLAALGGKRQLLAALGGKCQQVGACLAGRFGRRAVVGCTLSKHKHQLLAVGGVLGSVDDHDDQLLAACWRACVQASS